MDSSYYSSRAGETTSLPTTQGNLQIILFMLSTLASTSSGPLFWLINAGGSEAGGDKIPRKGGPGISQSDLLVINKVGCLHAAYKTISSGPQIDIAEYVGASLQVMDQDAKKMRDAGPTIFTSVKQGTGVEEVVDMILAAWKAAGSPGKPGPVTA